MKAEEKQVEQQLQISAIPFEEVLQNATEYFKGDALAAKVWATKYALKDNQGNIYERSPEDMHHRIAKELARIEAKYPNPMSENEIFDLLKDFRFIIPQGSPMSGIGNNFQIVSLSNCFVIGDDIPADSYGGIMKIDEEQVQLMKRRGGVGHDLSHIRPKGSLVKNSALTSTGIVPFMERYSNSTREVAQDGRRGALMLSINVKHPDVEDFIDAKLDTGKITGANVSVKLTDDFMQAVVNKTTYTQQYPVDSKNPKITKEIEANTIWSKIIHNAWKVAEPGVMFWDTILNESIPDAYADLGFRTISTNPCGEIPLCPYDSCRLLAMNLYSYVEKPFTKDAEFNLELFVNHVQKAQRMMDDIIDLESEKIDAILAKIDSDPESEESKRTERHLWEKIKEKSLKGRRTGLGITAEGDMLAALGVRYGSDEAIEFAVQVQKNLALAAYASSVNMAKERGAFPIYSAEREEHIPMIQRIKKESLLIYNEMKRYGRRNIALLTIAPTGSVSICTQTTSGIEPVFKVNYQRRRKINPTDPIENQNVFIDEVGDKWEVFNVFHPKFYVWLEANGYDVEEVKKYSEEKLTQLIQQSPYDKATANDIDWVAKVKMQGAVQQWVDHSISVTVNVPNDVSEDLVAEIYATAWKSGCKGMTVYRDGSRDGVLISNDSKKQEDENPDCIHESYAPKRPKRLECEVVRFQNDYEKWIAFVGLLNGCPYEVFTGKADGFIIPVWVQRGWIIKNKIGDEGDKRYDFEFEDKQGYKVLIQGLSRSFDQEFWNYAKLISGILRHGMPLGNVVNLISGLDLHNDSINTWKVGVERALKKFIPDGTKPKNNVCPKCKQESLIYQEGCLVCSSCGYSKCG
ncbi:MAG: adenosylcobalamin-dependent ribonucleoside-diphosphate reductase [Bacteroidales bacterium]|nr:adenosylcobalamin-dependent ribonucleoside-diphosphate reductase [Bacteroidales bacterium]